MTRGHSLLLIDDDDELGRLLTEYLGRYGHRLRCAGTAAAGLRQLRRQPPDLLILDLMLPDRDGLDLCRELRRDHDLPILMLTARGEVADRILGLEMGADDYLPKPFEPRELVARIDSVLRRGAPRTTRRLTCGALELRPEERIATLDGQPLELTSTEFELLRIFLTEAGRVLTREQLLLRLRGFDAEVYDRAVDMLVSRLRHKLGDDPRAPRFIKTVRRIGYQLAVEGGSS